MKVYYGNDTKFHAGSDAVSEAIVKRLTDQGHEIIGRCYRPYGPETQVMLQADALVVNGEGTFRDEKRAWEPGRIAALMDGMRRAKDAGLRVHFINATCCNMQPHWKSVLERCDELAVREVISQREMETTMGLRPAVYLAMNRHPPTQADFDNGNGSCQGRTSLDGDLLMKVAEPEPRCSNGGVLLPPSKPQYNSLPECFDADD